MSSLQVVVCLCALLVVALAGRVPREDKKYTTRYDNIDLDEILKSDRLLNSYLKCMMEEGKCTPDGEELKKNIPDALVNECKSCSETQKKGADKVITFLIKNKPEQWKKLSAKYDPTGIYQAKYDEKIKELTAAKE